MPDRGKVALLSWHPLPTFKPSTFTPAGVELLATNCMKGYQRAVRRFGVLALSAWCAFGLSGCSSGTHQTAPTAQQEERDRLLAENQQLPELRSQSEEVQRLKTENQQLPKLRSQYQEAGRLKKENEQL